MSAVSHEVINKNAAHFSHYAPKVLPLIGASISLWLYAARPVLLSCQFNAAVIAGSIALPFLVTLIAAIALKLYCASHYNNLVVEKLNGRADVWKLNNSQSKFLEWAFYAGASPDLKDILGNSLLVKAAGTDQHKIVQLLINARANLELKDDMGRTPLIKAVLNGRKENVQTLLNAGADPNCTDEYGDSVLKIAENSHNHISSPLAPLLIAAGAKQTSTESAG